MASKFEDERGVIEDLIGPVDAVTRIFTKKGAVRGNHVHFETTQWTYIVYGVMKIVTRDKDGHQLTRACKRGEIACEEPGVAHAWEALEDTLVLVFTRGPRSGEDYESDTFRMSGADRLIA